MKRFISVALCAFLAAGMLAGQSLAAETKVKTETLERGVLGTLNSSGASYEAKMTIPGYIGQLDIQLEIDGKSSKESVSVIKVEENAQISIDLTRFDGHIYNADLTSDRYVYTPGNGFEILEDEGGKGSSSQQGGSLDFGDRGGFYSGRVYFYYSMEELKYKTIDDIPDDKWGELYWFNLGSSYVLCLTDDDIKEFMDTGELDGYSWPGLRMLLSGEEDMELYINGDFDNFVRQDIYSQEVFTDVADQWYGQYVEVVYEYGLMKGASEDTFAPSGSMTVAEGLALVSRMHNVYHGMSGEFRQGTPWYEVYVGYALERGIIEEDTFDDYTRSITRREMAWLISQAIDLTRLEKINNFTEIPDVSRSDEDFACIQALYNIGVLVGSTEDGSFLPDNNITRAEVSAIVSRLVSSEMRIAASQD